MSIEVREAFRALTPAAVITITALMQSDDERIKLDATKYALDRGWGRPTEKIAGDADESPIRFIAPTDAQMGLLARRVCE